MDYHKSLKFQVYRYLLNVKTAHFPISFNGISLTGSEEIDNHKNNIFKYVISSINGENTAQIVDIVELSDSIFHIRYAKKKDLEVTSKKGEKQSFESWPRTEIIVDFERQLIAVYIHKGAFAKVETATNQIKKILQDKLINYYIQLNIYPITKKSSLWNFIRDHSNIVELTFKLPQPNMPRLSSMLPEAIKDLQKSTNSDSIITIKGNGNQSLKLEEDNDSINALNNYTSQAGGDISARIINNHSKIMIEKEAISFHINEEDLFVNELYQTKAEKIDRLLDIAEKKTED